MALNEIHILSALMNGEVYNFKRYEGASVVYLGINRHAGEDIYHSKAKTGRRS